MATKTDAPTTKTTLPQHRDVQATAPVPMHHRLKLGIQEAGFTNPNGNGNPSTVPSTGKRGW